MTGLAIFFCVLATATVFLRAEMLRQRLDPKRSEPGADCPRHGQRTYLGNMTMIVGLDFAGIGFVGMLIAILIRRYVPSPELVFLLGTCAISSGISLISMIGHNWREVARQAECDAADTVENTLASALEAGVERFIRGEPPRRPRPPLGGRPEIRH